MIDWYYRDAQSRKVGPLSTEEFEERVTEGEIQGHTRVWRSGLTDWTTYDALLAHEANCHEVTSGPASSAAPHSRSYSTVVALGASAASRPSHGGGIATPAATPHGMAVPHFEKCRQCGEDVPSNLFREVGRRRLCGFCVQKQEVKARRDKLREARGVDSNWIGKFFVRCALIAGAFVLGRVLLFELKHASNNSSPSLLPRVEVSLPPDSDPVPTTGR